MSQKRRITFDILLLQGEDMKKFLICFGLVVGTLLLNCFLIGKSLIKSAGARHD